MYERQGFDPGFKYDKLHPHHRISDFGFERFSQSSPGGDGLRVWHERWGG